MSSARETALRVLERCRRDGAWSARVLDRLLQEGDLDEREAALAAQLSLGTLQNQRYLDHYIDLYCRAGKLEPKLRDLLRLGAYQLLFLDKIPAHAAVDESVALCRRLGLSRAAGLVNAILRRLSENRGSLPEIPGKGTADYLAIRYSQANWLAEELVRQRGYEFTEAFFSACQQPSRTDIQLNTLKTTRDDYLSMLARTGTEAELPPFPDHCLALRGGKISMLPGYEEGLFFVQDRAAAMAVEIARPRPGMKVLDACAAPGGKSFAAAIRMENRGKLISCDLHEKKLPLIRSGAERLGLSIIEVMAQNASVRNPGFVGAFDLVIADLPCSGFGVMRKKPEIRTKSQEETQRLPAVQHAILDNLSAYVAPGGTLLYATCTVLRQENEEQIERFLREHPDFSPSDFTVDGRASQGGFYTFWPQIDGTDGFFTARLIRRQA